MAFSPWWLLRYLSEPSGYPPAPKPLICLTDPRLSLVAGIDMQFSTHLKCYDMMFISSAPQLNGSRLGGRFLRNRLECPDRLVLFLNSTSSVEVPIWVRPIAWDSARPFFHLRTWHCLPVFLNQVRVKELPSSPFLHLDLLHSRSNQSGTFEASFL